MDNKTALITIARFTQATSIVLFMAVLYFARDIFIPMSLGVLFAFLLSPVVDRLQRLGLSNLWAVLFTATSVFLGLTAFLFAMWSGLSSFNEELPQYSGELKKKLEYVQSKLQSMGGTFNQLSGEISESEDAGDTKKKPNDETENRQVAHRQTPPKASSTLDRIFGNLPETQNNGSSPSAPLYVKEAPSRKIDIKTWAGGATAILGPIGTAGLVAVFALFALLYRDDLRDRFTSLISHGNYVVTTEALNEAADRIGKYLMAQVIINISYGFVFVSGLLVIGYFLTPDKWFPYVMVLGTIAGLVRFIPYVGPLIGAGIPLLVSLLLFPGYQVVLAVGALILVMELISNNVVEPWLYGTSTGVSAMAIIISAIFWGWLWGPIGLLLATPLTVCAVVLGQYVPRFKFLNMLLSEEVHIKPSVRGYQRLLSTDQHKFTEFINEERKDSSALEFLDETVVSIVKLIINDNDKHGVSDNALFDRLENGLISSKMLPDPNAAEAEKSKADTDEESVVDEASADSAVVLPRVVGVAARHQGEEIVLRSMGYALRDKIDFMLYESAELPDRQAVEIVESNPALIIIDVIPPNGMSQGRFWCSALRSAGYKGAIVVACHGRFKNFDNVFTSFRKRGATWVTTSVGQTTSTILSVLKKPTKNALQAPSPRMILEATLTTK
ncbi:MAG: AI-2E family transporter [Pirellulaceae bacterium]